MNVTVQKPSKTSIVIAVAVPAADVLALAPSAAEKISGDIEIEGFRKGKAPYEVVKSRVGEFKIFEEAARTYILRHFSEILEEAKEKEFKDGSFEPIGDPDISITKLAPGSDLEFTIKFSILPPISLPDYKAIAARVMKTRAAPVVEEEEVRSSIEWLRESRTKTVTVARAAGAGDRVEIDFSGLVGGVPAEGLQSKNHPLILGTGRFMPGFEENLIGMKAGDEKEFDLVLPDEFRDRDLAGKRAHFRVAMRLVQEREIPDWDDAFAASVGDFPTAQKAEDSIREGLRAEKESGERERLRMAALDEIAKDTKADLPEELVAQEIERMVAELGMSASRIGLKIEDYLKHAKKTPEDLKKDFRADAVKRVKIALALREIARAEKIEPTDEEIQAAMDRTAERQGLGEKDLKTIDRGAFMAYNRGIARNEKVLAWLESCRSS